MLWAWGWIMAAIAGSQAQLCTKAGAEASAASSESTNVSQHLTIPQRFAAAVQRARLAVALRKDDIKPTYAELDGGSNRLAGHLCGKGVEQGDLVGILGHRSVATITAILAVLKAGAAYVPLDAGYPAE